MFSQVSVCPQLAIMDTGSPLGLAKVQLVHILLECFLVNIRIIVSIQIIVVTRVNLVSFHFFFQI